MPRKEFESFTRLDASDVNTYLMDQSVMTFAGTAARGSAITTPVEGMVTYLEDSDAFEYWDSAEWTSLAPAAPSGNAIINGAFDIWQRGTSFTSGGYTSDRWTQVTDKTVTTSRQTFSPGTAPVAGYEGQFFLRQAVNSGGTFQVLSQLVEDVRTFAGTTVTLSYWAKADAPVDNNVVIAQNFGTGGSTSVDSSPIIHALTTSWARYTATFTLPSISGKTIGTNSFLDLRVIRTIDALAHTVDIWGVQLEAGPVATPFRRNANSLQGELAACQRYAFSVNLPSEGSFTRFGLGQAFAGTSAAVQLYPPVRLRAAPTSITTAGTIALFDGSTFFNSTSITMDTPTTNVANLSVGVASGLTQHRPYVLIGNNSATASIIISAEL
jgi:hypothetical protein